MLVSIVIFLVGLLGAGLISIGTWMIYPPAGVIVGGLLLLMMSWMSARSFAERLAHRNRS